MRRFRTVWVPVLVFGLVLAVLLGGWRMERASEEAQNRVEFQALSRQVAVRVHEFVDTRVRLLEHMAYLMASSPDIQGAYDQMVADLYQRFPGFQALNLVDARGVIVRVYPLDANRMALRHDLSSSRRSGALYRTMRHSRRPVLSGVIPLFGGGTGCSLFVPVVRDAQVVGTLLAVFDAAEMVRACLTDGILESLNIEIRVSGKDLFTSGSMGAEDGSRLCTSIAVPVVDRNWEFHMCKGPDPSTGILENYLVLFGALLVAGLSAFMSRKYLQEQEMVRQSENRLSALLAAVPDIMMVVTRDGRVVDLHTPPGVTWFLHAKPDPVTGVSLDGLLSPELAEWVQAHIPGCLETMLPVRTEGSVAGPSGPVTVEVVLSVYDDADVLLTLRDITARRMAERRLRESEQQLRTIFEASQDAIFMTSSDGRILAVNQAGVALLGASSVDELMGMSALDLYENPDERTRLLHALKAHGLVSNWEVRLRRLDGSVFPAMVSTRKLTMANGTECLIGTMKDLSEIKELQMQLVQAQKLESIGRLAGGIAHDFNNILSSVLGYATLMKTKMSPEHPFYQYVETIERGAVRAGELTAQLLGFARKGQYEMGPVDINRLVTDTVTLLSSTIEKSIEIQTRQTPDLPPVYGDLSQLHQVVMNLCVNARDAMPDGGVLTIETDRVSEDEIRASRVVGLQPGEYVRLSVRDTGIGMSREVMERIFEPFFTTKEQGKGTGLGLSMVYGVIRNHQGAVQVESEPGKGTVFHVYLPVMTEQSDVESGSDEESSALSDESGSGEGHTVLFADDEPDNRSLAQEILEFAGYRVLMAEDGRQAVEQFRNHAGEIDGVILDLIMPKMGGIETLAEIRKQDRDVPVLFVSGYAPDDAVKEDMAREHALFVRKPFQLREFLEKVQEMIGAVPER